MAVYHERCRVNAGHGAGPTREAKYNGRCAWEGCKETPDRGYIVKGAIISCTRDNEGKRKAGPRSARTGSASVATPTPAIEPSPKSALSPIAAAILGEIQPHLPDAKIDRDYVIDVARREMVIATDEMTDNVVAKVTAQIRPALSITIVEQPIEGPPAQREMGLQHKQFPLLLQMIRAGVNVWITGPAGSGKTTAVHNAAIALGREYSYTGSSGDAYAVTGYMGATGAYVPTAFRRAYESETPHVHLLDEVDGWDPNALLALNAALANGTASFPDRMVTKGRVVMAACANTIGHGATQEYCGRMRQDFAFLDRWTVLSWETDHDLETETSGNRDWASRVQTIRARVKERGIKALITPRATYRGAALLAQGLDMSVVEACELASRMTPEQWKAVK